MNILLIRHGECQQNEADPALTSSGQVQAQQLAKLLNQILLTKVYVSDNVRAVKTFEEYIKLNPNTRFVKTNKLREIYRTLVGGPKKVGTDPLREARDKTRIDSFWHELLESKDETVAIFTHGNVIRYLLANVLGMKPENSWTRMVINCCSISLIQKDKDSICVKLINSIDHLEQPSKIYTGPVEKNIFID